MQSESIVDLAKALVAVQAEMPTVKKDSINPFYKSKYANLANVMESATPILTKHGLAVTQFVTNIDGATGLTTTLMHTSGEWIKSTMPLILPKDDPQGQGSAITYARRYSYMSAIGVVADEDDDGNRASNGQTRYVKPPTREERIASLTPLEIAKGELVKNFFDKGITNHKDMATINRTVLKKATVDTVEEAEQVTQYLEEQSE